MLETGEKRVLKIKLREYLLSVLAEEEYYNTLEKCREEVRRTQGYLLARGRQLPFCCSEWLRGLPIGVEFMTWNICKMIFDWLGWSYDDNFSLGKLYVGGRKFDTLDLDNLYWKLLGEIIAEDKRK